MKKIIILTKIVFLSAITFVYAQKNTLFSAWTGSSIVKDKTEAQIDSALQQYNNAGIKALFIETHSPDDNDVYTRIIPLAKKYNIQINAWRWTMNSGFFLKDHPEYYQVSASGKSCADNPPYVSYYRWMCPNEPAVKHFLIKEYLDLAKIDGLHSVHFDYVRYCDVFLPVNLQPKYSLVQDHVMPDYDFCYCSRCVKGFKDKTGLDALHLLNKKDSAKWLSYRLDVLVNLVNEVCKTVHNETKTLVTAAVFPTPNSSIQSVRQDWGRYEIDVAMPMLYNGFYNENYKWIGKCIKEGLRTMKVKKPIVSGVYMPDVKTPQDLEQVINVSMKNGAGGVCFFGLSLKDDDKLNVIKSFFEKYSIMPKGKK